MTDMRATKRLLEAIEECAAKIAAGSNLSEVYADEIVEAITELRRRGDTLVRRDDLRTALEGSRPEYVTVAEGDAIEAAIDRLEIALGGKLR
jgi:hypothetical protein